MRKIYYILLLLLISITLQAKQYSDSAIYQGLYIKLDLATPIMEVARTKGKLQNYEVALSVRLKNRYYPTLEGGYAFGTREADGGVYRGHGGFAKVGMDFNGLRKNAASPHALLVGLRIGTALQQYDLTNLKMNTPYWDSAARTELLNNLGCDVWGEVLGGCNVQIAKCFYMGWNVRLKLLFTRKAKGNQAQPYYIPGYGYRDNVNWGINYYIGFHI